MIVALLAAALQTVATPSPATPSPAKPAAASPPPAASVAAAPEPDLGAPTAEGLESLKLAYHDSCEVRLYGEYDDMCSSLSDQIRQYRAALAKAARKARPR